MLEGFSFGFTTGGVKNAGIKGIDMRQLFFVLVVSVFAFKALASGKAMTTLPEGHWEGTMVDVYEDGTESPAFPVTLDSSGSAMGIEVSRPNSSTIGRGVYLKFQPDGSCEEIMMNVPLRGTCMDGKIALKKQYTNEANQTVVEEYEYWWQPKNVLTIRIVEPLVDSETGAVKAIRISEALLRKQ